MEEFETAKYANCGNELIQLRADVLLYANNS